MNCIATLAAGFIAALLLLTQAAAGPSHDSLAYCELRTQVMHSDPANQALATADALFNAGLFAEALSLLREHATVVAGPTQSSRRDNVSRVQWRTSSGIDYYHLEDLDTATMTPEELRDYKRLTETPLSLWLRAKATVRPQAGPLTSMDPEAYLSERKGRFAATARYASQGGAFRFEPSAKAEKWFRSDASGNAPFAPVEKQPSDMGGAAVRMAFESPHRETSSLRFSVPVSVDWEHYRSDRPGYESMVEYRFLPTLELPQGTLPLYLRLLGQAEYEDYYRKESDTLDVVRLSGRIEGNARNDHRSGTISVAWSGDRYTNNARPSTIDRLDAAIRGECAVAKAVSLRLRLRGLYETERGGGPDGVAYLASGSEIVVCPGLETVFLGKRFRAGPELLWERRWGGASILRSVWYGRTAFEGGLRTGWSDGALDASARAAYRFERFDDQFKQLPTTDDNRSLRAGAELSASPVAFLSLDLFADYQYRVYAPYGTTSRVSENITVSLSVTARW